MLLPDYEYEYGSAPELGSYSGPAFRRILGLHVSGHDSSVAVVEDGEVVEVIEFERVIREKRCRIYPGSARFERSIDWLFNDYKLASDFDAVAVQVNSFRKHSYEIVVKQLHQFIPNAHYVLLNHHLCHAAAAYFTSPFNSASIISYDGQGNDGTTLGFVAEGNRLQYVKSWPITFGCSYRALGSIIGGIYESDNHTSGKTMGLTAYGAVVEQWKEPIKRFIRHYWPMREEVAPWEPSIADAAFYLDGFGPVKGHNTFGGPTSIAGQNFAHTFQLCWTEMVLECISELLNQTAKKKLCVVGGAALNVITNRAIADMTEVDDVHFIPNCNDSGIAMGAALYCYYSYQGKAWNGTPCFFDPYKGLSILDLNELNEFATNRNALRITDPYGIIANLLAEGKTVGILQGRSEIGPRALGNRSILCDPRDIDLKRRLNENIKGREWFRPFAPVVREEDRSIYFDCNQSAPYMSVIGFTKPEWRSHLAAVTHVDGSARLQTVSRSQNPFLWELLGKVKCITGVGILLNTSLNGKGEPIIAKVRDGLRLLDETGLDVLYCEGWLFNSV